MRLAIAARDSAAGAVFILAVQVLTRGFSIQNESKA